MCWARATAFSTRSVAASTVASIRDSPAALRRFRCALSRPFAEMTRWGFMLPWLAELFFSAFGVRAGETDTPETVVVVDGWGGVWISPKRSSWVVRSGVAMRKFSTTHAAGFRATPNAPNTANSSVLP